MPISATSQERSRQRRPRERLRAALAWDGPHRGRRLFALAAAVAVPAMAAPGEWRGFAIPSEESAATAPMPFETPGASFPGSAFFYLEDLPDAPATDLALADDLPPPIDTGAHSDAEPLHHASGLGMNEA